VLPEHLHIRHLHRSLDECGGCPNFPHLNAAEWFRGLGCNFKYLRHEEDCESSAVCRCPSAALHAINGMSSSTKATAALAHFIAPQFLQLL
jgi:hypothetical protein